MQSRSATPQVNVPIGGLRAREESYLEPNRAARTAIACFRLIPEPTDELVGIPFTKQIGARGDDREISRRLIDGQRFASRPPHAEARGEKAFHLRSGHRAKRHPKGEAALACRIEVVGEVGGGDKRRFQPLRLAEHFVDLRHLPIAEAVITPVEKAVRLVD